MYIATDRSGSNFVGRIKPYFLEWCDVLSRVLELVLECEWIMLKTQKKVPSRTYCRFLYI